MTLADRLAEVPAEKRFLTALKWSGIPQNQLADLFGVSPRVVNYWYTGKAKNVLEMPPYRAVVRLARAIGVPPELIGGEPVQSLPRSTDPTLPPEWVQFASTHRLSMQELIDEAVNEYIWATEAQENGYRPDVDEQPLAEPLVIMSAAALLKIQERKPLERYDGVSPAPEHPKRKGKSTITNKDVWEIKAARTALMGKLAKKYGIGDAGIRGVWKGESWKEVRYDDYDEKELDEEMSRLGVA
jgi:transcriptional regulator with XRE-family HTH domain